MVDSTTGEKTSRQNLFNILGLCADPDEALQYYRSILYTRGSLQNNTVSFYSSEGLETGLSVVEAVERSHSVATLGKTNFLKLDPAILLRNTNHHLTHFSTVFWIRIRIGLLFLWIRIPRSF